MNMNSDTQLTSKSRKMFYLALLLILSAIASLFLSGCATSGAYTQKVSSWVGHDVDELVSVWGYPQMQFNAPNGNVVYGYGTFAQGQVPVYTTAPGFAYGQYSFGGQTTNWYCQTYFETDKDKRIVTWRWAGNNCK